jgi:hypothetical protein
MILGAEIALVVLGIYALVKGKLTLTKKKVVYGTPARLLAIIAFLPMPLSLMIGVIYGVVLTVKGQDVTSPGVRLTMIGIEAGVLILCTAALYGLGWQLAKPPEPQKAGFDV